MYELYMFVNEAWELYEEYATISELIAEYGDHNIRLVGNNTNVWSCHKDNVNQDNVFVGIIFLRR